VPKSGQKHVEKLTQGEKRERKYIFLPPEKISVMLPPAGKRFMAPAQREEGGFFGVMSEGMGEDSVTVVAEGGRRG
jgi:hypothetical protein